MANLYVVSLLKEWSTALSNLAQAVKATYSGPVDEDTADEAYLLAMATITGYSKDETDTADSLWGQFPELRSMANQIYGAAGGPRA